MTKKVFIQITPRQFYGAFVSPQNDISRPRLEKYYSQNRKIPHSLSDLKDFLDLFDKARNLHYVISTDYHLATTIQSGATIIRADNKTPITQNELAGAVGKALWKVVNQQRPKAAKKMRAKEIETDLCAADALFVRLDRKQPSSVIGQKSRTIEFWFQATFAPKQVISTLLQAGISVSNLRLEETAGVFARLITELPKVADKFLFVDVLEEETVFYECRDKALHLIDVINWGTDMLHGSIQSLLGVAEPEAKSILKLYESKAVGKNLRETLEKEVGGELAILLNGIDNQTKRHKAATVFLLARQPLPKLIQSAPFREKIGIKTSLQIVDKAFVAQKYSFGLKLDRQVEENIPDSLVGSIAHDAMYFALENDLQKLVHQRARFLSRSLQKT